MLAGVSMISVFAVSTTYEFNSCGKGCIEDIRDVEYLSSSTPILKNFFFIFVGEIQFEWSGNRRWIEDITTEVLNGAEEIFSTN
jgi:ABC-type arginine/histidine transport system permease subunit